MKLTDYVMNYLHAKGTRHVFGMSGGAAVHMFDSATKHAGMGVTFVAHEQSAAIAADAYYRVSGKLGACVVTSGPGATNLLTGVCCSYYDSVPALMLTGQVATPRLKGARKVRQVGFQETDVLSVYASVTKSVQQISNAHEIVQALDNAYAKAEEKRPGPLLIDIPDDLQRAAITPDDVLREPALPEEPSLSLGTQVSDLLQKIAAAKRPLIVIGGGFSTPRKVDELREFLSHVDVPIVQTWAGIDLLPHDWKHRLGTFGVYGARLGNFAVQNADLLVCLGTRLSQNLTGGVLSSFASDADIVMVDVDPGEMDKFDGYGIAINTRIAASLADFLQVALALVKQRPVVPEITSWLAMIAQWKQ